MVEAAPKLRTGGYLIDFWGAGFDIADRMGLLAEISRKGYKVREVRVVNRAGNGYPGFQSMLLANDEWPVYHPPAN